MHHRPELDGLRGVAILIVLASHTRLAGFAIEGGFAGVTLFFVLSGFLITSLLVAELGSHGRVDLRAFYIRRGLRLLPAMFALLAVVAVGYALNAWPSPPAPRIASVPVSLVAVAAYVPNWAAMAIPMGVLGHTWSLGVEEQFYLAWPIALLAGRRLLGPRGLALVALALAVLVTPWRHFLLAVLGSATTWGEPTRTRTPCCSGAPSRSCECGPRPSLAGSGLAASSSPVRYGRAARWGRQSSCRSPPSRRLPRWQAALRYWPGARSPTSVGSATASTSGTSCSSGGAGQHLWRSRFRSPSP